MPSKDPNSGLLGQTEERPLLLLEGLGLPPSDADRRRVALGQPPADALLNFQRLRGLPATGELDAPTSAALEAALTAAIYRVEGSVRAADGVPASGLAVRLIDKNVGRDVPLEPSVATDTRGRYRIEVLVAPFGPAGKTQPDLQLQVLAGGEVVGTSAVRYNAGPSEVIDVVLPADAKGMPSEFERLTSALAPHVPGSLAQVKETAEQKDVTYLAHKVGWDARAVAMAALAARFGGGAGPDAAEEGVDPALYYALFRAGVPANADALAQITPERARAVWDQAIESGLIPARLAPLLHKAEAAFRRLTSSRSLEARPLPGGSTLGELLRLSLGDDAARASAFADLRLQHRNDPEALWGAVTRAFGAKVAKRLRLDGQLAFLTLNNASLVFRLHEDRGAAALSSPLDLVKRGLFSADAWGPLIEGDIPVQVPGETDEARRANYASMLAAQVRLSYPTAVVAERIRRGDIPLVRKAGTEAYRFLAKHQGEFEIGVEPIDGYLARQGLEAEVSPAAVAALRQVQRVYQITPNDEAMGVLIEAGLDSAYSIAQWRRQDFVAAYGARLGERNAELIHGQAAHVHDTVQNLVAAYAAERRGLTLGMNPDAPILAAASRTPSSPPTGGAPQARSLAASADPASSSSVIAYATLETLFGSLDYCSCELCRSILSPAAYLVDLLMFLAPPGVSPSPQSVLLGRRPDIERVKLTCENTNTPQPQIDIVNEILEQYVANALSLDGFAGHETTDEIPVEELSATPQFVNAGPYATLQADLFPPPLPFHNWLENLRLCFDKFGAPLPATMEALRPSDSAWGAILLEYLKLSATEAQILTDSSLTLTQLYGFAPSMTTADAQSALTNLKAFTRRIGISYEDAISLLRTRFVNPSSGLVRRMERLNLPVSALKTLYDDTIGATDAAFDASLPIDLDPAEYGGDVKGWVRANYPAIRTLIVISNPNAPDNLCDLDSLEFHYCDPDAATSPLPSFEFVRMLRFIRLWKALGWTLEQTDQALTALYPGAQVPTSQANATALTMLDAGFGDLLPRLGSIVRLLGVMKLKPGRDLPSLLACFAPIGTYGDGALYRQLFLNAALTDHDPDFAPDSVGGVFANPIQPDLLDHADTLRAAFGLTADEFSRIVAALGYTATTPLTLDAVSAVFRRGWMARKLRMSVAEFEALIAATGLDPFAPATPLDPPNPPVFRFLALTEALRIAGVKPVLPLYAIWDVDIAGNAAPDEVVISSLARSLRAGFAQVDSDFQLTPGADPELARARIALVYGAETTDQYFGLLTGATVFDIFYTQAAAALDPALIAAGGGALSYDHFRKRLSHAGVMSAAIKTQLDAAALSVLSAVEAAAFSAAVLALHHAADPFFARHPELLAPFTAYTASTQAEEVRRQDLLNALLPELLRQRKRQQALACVIAATRADPALVETVTGDAGVLQSAGSNPGPVLDDFTAAQVGGLTTRFFWAATVGTAPDLQTDVADAPDYSSSSPLPANLNAAGQPISLSLTGYLEAPETGFCNILVEADGGAAISLSLDGQAVLGSVTGGVWSNLEPIAVTAGALSRFQLAVENTTTACVLRWERAGRGREVIPSRWLYAETMVQTLRTVHGRITKLAMLAGGLKLSAAEISDLAKRPEYAIGGAGWANSLPVGPGGAAPALLLHVLTGLVDFARIKAAVSSGADDLRSALADLTALTPDRTRLLALTGWAPDSLDALKSHFALATDADLVPMAAFVRIYDALAIARAMGVSASALIAGATSTNVDETTVSALQSALRARYDHAAWLEVIKSINDKMRMRRRDALVAHILQANAIQSPPSTVDTPDKLFEHFLIDVEMEPCMQTSRIRSAIASVQIFIDRCVMNLESEVSPAAIDTGRWSWMNRYQIWSANRQVFCFPENFLEPEFRDDQSPIFKEVMGALLQSDINEETAASALLDYLSHLEEIAKLEPCAIHLVEQTPGVQDDVAHVIARTAGANRKYFYGRCEYGSWTPWEQIKLDIEDNPVLPVIWRGRLMLFWLRLLQQMPDAPAQQPAASVQSGDSIGTALNRIQTDVNAGASKFTKSAVKAVLCWSEYYDGKWRPMKTSDVAAPVLIGLYPPSGPGAFSRSKLNLYQGGGDDRLEIHIQAGLHPKFVLYNTHSLPLRGSDVPSTGVTEMISYTPAPWRDIDVSTAPLSLEYANGMVLLGTQGLNRVPLANAFPDHVVYPRHSLDAPWVSPFFYSDARYSFYVTTEKTTVTLPLFAGYGASLSASAGSTSPGLFHLGSSAIGEIYAAPDTTFVNPLLSNADVNAAGIEYAIAGGQVLVMGDVAIGASGSTDASSQLPK